MIFGVLAVLLTYALGRRILDRTTALIAAILLAVLPIAIIYSRLGWEYAEVPLLCLLVIYFAARANRIGLIVSYLAAIHVSPTVVFLLPVPLGLLAARLLDRPAGEGEPSRPGRRSVLVTLGTLLAIIGAIGLLKRNNTTTQWIYATYDFGPCDWPRFGTLYMRQVLGFCHGPPSVTETSLALAWGFWGAIAALVVVGGWRLWRDRAWDRLALVLGWIASASSYHLVVGPDGFHPAMPRYGLFLCVPMVLALACLVRRVLSIAETAADTSTRRISWRRVQIATGFGVAWALLIFFAAGFFHRFEMEGRADGESFWTLRTESADAMERMASILRRDFEARGEGRPGPLVVVAEDSWISRPVEFLLGRREGLKVGQLEGITPEDARQILERRLRSGGYAVGKASHPLDETVRSLFPPEQLRHWHVKEGARPLYVVYRLKRPDDLPTPRCGHDPVFALNPASVRHN